MEHVKELFNKYGIELSESQAEKFGLYYNLLTEYNGKFNITSVTEEKEVYIKHFIDSVIGIKFINKGNLIDIGSGGGFPLVPIKIIKEDLSVTAVESTGKKCEFLEVLGEKLGFKNFTVLNGRAEDFSKTAAYREKFDYCTSRAVARYNTLCEYCIPFVKKGGLFIAYKGDADEEVKESENALKVLGCKIKEKYDFLLEDAKRSLIIAEKIKNTPEKYPRGHGKERKNPL